MLQLDDPRRTQELCDAEAKAGKKVHYDKTYRAMFEYYEDLNAVEIKNKIEAELKKAGGELKDI